MKTIHKYPISSEAFQLQLPEDFQPIKVALQGPRRVFWAIHGHGELKLFMFHVVPTGGNVADHWKYAGTWFEGIYVWHLFYE